MKNGITDIPKYDLENFRPLHRHSISVPPFGHNIPDDSKIIEGFQLYSSDGMISAKGPLKSIFYRIGITVTGSLNMQVGLDKYEHQPRTLTFTFPSQIFSTDNVSEDAFGYYMFFTAEFLNDIIPAIKIAEEFPFYDFSGTPVFQIENEELENILGLVMKINAELQGNQTGRIKAVKMYVYLLLLEAKRSYVRQNIGNTESFPHSFKLISRFRKLVAQHYLDKKQVNDYAQMLGVSPNHLNRIVKEKTGKTASEVIKEMILQEAKSLLRYTGNSVAEIAYRLDFSDPASFNRFFKSLTNETPLIYRSRQN
ncbi:AraC family transcriptional regulator [Mucilaginibacter terrae]|uniref:AraC family transcriptional activator of pobA n=1 Tax=Mucilaginibacter terrae TaxID=1955052 RepID=A0ABU3GN13_9SPHI|nr:helix-turn-helix domain-containing protein [Mucilaginibacter terrae]MDT3401005.1 AraC family transcriptional activator of pobA [Mucilaginibacter terrae]